VCDCHAPRRVATDLSSNPRLPLTPLRLLCAVGLALLYLLVSIWCVRAGRWPLMLGVVFTFAGVLIALCVALTRRRRPAPGERAER
jgi:peptidoglycan/LPS O-acetylase OafA/YrhL